MSIHRRPSAPSPRRPLRSLLGWLAGVALASASSTAGADAAEAFRDLRKALAQGDATTADARLSTLQASPLAGYAELAVLRARLEHVPVERAAAFLHDHQNIAAAPAFRIAWMRELARREEWRRLDALFNGARDVHVRCAVVRARIALGRHAAAVALARDLWAVGYRQPGSCNKAFDLLERVGELTPQRLMQRMRLALAAGNPDLARAYIERLPPTQRAVVRRWIGVYEQPASARQHPPADLGDTAARADVLQAALTALARRDPSAARRLWQRLSGDYGLPAPTRATIQRTIALQGVYSGIPEARDWLRALPDEATTPTVHAWRVRSALRDADWADVRRAVARMSEAQRQRPRWRYWHARAAEQLGEDADAKALFAAAAQAFSYYGFLAADRLGQPYHWGAEHPPTDSQRHERVRAHAGISRALLLYKADEHAWAGDAWRQAVRGLDTEDRLAAARIAEARAWAWATLYASGMAGVDNASTLRFPLGYRSTVMRSARHGGRTADWLFALIRQESAFQRTACSHAGACGLMQLMPGTARWMLERMNRPTDDIPGTLADPTQSIPAGAAYLAYLRQRFVQPAVALAAYNAGPGNVDDWLDDAGAPPGTVRWVETLPFGETRDYVTAVLFNRTVYHLRLNGHAERLGLLFRGHVPGQRTARRHTPR